MRKLTLISGLMLVAFAAAASAAEKQVKPGKPVKSRRSRGENMQAARKTNRKPVAVERLVRGSQPLFRSERYVAYEERAGSGGRGRVSVLLPPTQASRNQRPRLNRSTYYWSA